MTNQQAQDAITALQTTVEKNSQDIAIVRTEAAKALDETRALAIELKTVRPDIMKALDETRALALNVDPMAGTLAEVDERLGKAQELLKTTQEELQANVQPIIN